MPLPAVAIELSPTDAASPEAAVLVEACSRSLPNRGCRIGSGESPGEASAVAIVRRRDEFRYVIELGVRRAGESRWFVREVSFQPDDPVTERWRAVGFVIGTLVGEAEMQPEGPSARPAPRATPAPRPTARYRIEREPSSRAPSAWLGADGVTGTGLDDGTWRWGGGVRANLQPWASGAFATASARYELRSRDELGLAVEWLSVALGGGFGAAITDLVTGEAALALVAEHIHASVDEPQTGATDEGSRWVLGGRLEAGVRISASPRLALWIGGDATAAPGSTRIDLHRREVAAVANPQFGAAIGVRFRLF